jgi:hypothetical protein
VTCNDIGQSIVLLITSSHVWAHSHPFGTTVKSLCLWLRLSAARIKQLDNKNTIVLNLLNNFTNNFQAIQF